MSDKAVPDATQLLQSLLAGLRIERGGSYGSGGGTIYQLSPGQLESHIDHRVASELSRCLADNGYVIASQVELDELRAKARRWDNYIHSYDTMPLPEQDENLDAFLTRTAEENHLRDAKAAVIDDMLANGDDVDLWISHEIEMHRARLAAPTTEEEGEK